MNGTTLRLIVLFTAFALIAASSLGESPTTDPKAAAAPRGFPVWPGFSAPARQILTYALIEVEWTDADEQAFEKAVGMSEREFESRFLQEPSRRPEEFASAVIDLTPSFWSVVESIIENHGVELRQSEMEKHAGVVVLVASSLPPELATHVLSRSVREYQRIASALEKTDIVKLATLLRRPGQPQEQADRTGKAIRRAASLQQSYAQMAAANLKLAAKRAGVAVQLEPPMLVRRNEIIRQYADQPHRRALTVEEFFDGNPEPLSIAPDPHWPERPDLDQFRAVLEDVRARPSVHDVRIGVASWPDPYDPFDDEEWFSASVVYVWGTCTEEELHEWTAPLSAPWVEQLDGARAGRGVVVDGPEAEPGLLLYYLVWE